MRNMNNDIDLYDIYKLFKKKWKIILLIILFFTLIGEFLGYLIPPTYEARTDILVNYTKDRDSGTGLQTNEIETSLRLVETFSHMLKSDRMNSKVISVLKEPYVNIRS